MRTIHTDEIIKNIKEMCIEANLSLTEDMKCRFKNATESEKSPLGKQILNQLQENMEIAAADQIPICQDTGMAIVFLNIGQDVHIEGMDLHDAVNEGVRQGYTEGYLRKSVVKDPLIRENTKDNESHKMPCMLWNLGLAGTPARIIQTISFLFTVRFAEREM